jgi:hypothetical protein
MSRHLIITLKYTDTPDFSQEINTFDVSELRDHYNFNGLPYGSSIAFNKLDDILTELRESKNKAKSFLRLISRCPILSTSCADAGKTEHISDAFDTYIEYKHDYQRLRDEITGLKYIVQYIIEEKIGYDYDLGKVRLEFKVE